MSPLNDFCQIELESNEYDFKGADKEVAESGILTALPDKFNYFGYYSFGFEDSLLNPDKLQALYDYYKQLIGKRVYWLALSEKGAVVEIEGKRYAFLKLTSLIGWSEANIKGTAIGSGQFSA